MRTSVVYLAAAALTAMAISGCTSMKPLPGATSTAVATLVAGQRVRVLDNTGESVDLTLVVIGPDFVEGRTGDNRVVRYELAHIDELSVRRSAPGKTVALVIGMVYLAGVVALAEAQAAFLAGL